MGSWVMKKWLLASSILVALLCLTLVLSLVSLDGEWLKHSLANKARETLQADLTIRKIEFSPFQGKASLEGIVLSRRTEASDLDVNAHSVDLKVRLWPLLYRSVQIERLVLDGPEVVFVERRAPRQEGGTADKIKGFAKKKLSDVQKAGESRSIDWFVQHLIIRKGAVQYRAVREAEQPFELKLGGMEYSASDVSLTSFYRLVYGADITSRVWMGSEALLEKAGSKTPSTLLLTGVDLDYLDRYFDQTDALVVAGGMMEVRCVAEGVVRNRVEVVLKGLKLGSNPEAASQEFLFVPVDRVIRYAGEKQGNLSLVFAVNHVFEASDDLESIASEFWKGLWIAVLKEVSPGSVRDLMDEGKNNALDGLRDPK